MFIYDICDSFPHGNRFSDYDDKNEQEELLVESLGYCRNNNFKIIALLLNEFSRKAFLECQKIYYDENDYKIFDLTDIKIKNITFQDITRKILEKEIDNFEIENTKEEDNEFNYVKTDDYTCIESFEKDFEFENCKIRMESLEYNSKYNDYSFLPDIDGHNLRSTIKYLNQANSSILSILLKTPNVLKYIFPKLSYNRYSKNISMNVYKNGVKRKITFDNTYAFEYKNDYSESIDLIFSKPLDKTFVGLCLEKGYAVLNSDKKTIKSGYDNIGHGGQEFEVFNSFFGNPCEYFNFFNNILI